jgi:hypothetical protein
MIMVTEKMLRVADAFAAIRAVGMTARYRDGEWRVCPKGGKEAEAYYTNDPEDAVGTAKLMARGI